MNTWQLQNGDLVFGPHGFAEVNGTDKIQQDLEIAALEPYGCDPYHPGWGSLLANYIGNVISATSGTLVTSEISRLVQNYILVQQDAIATEISQGTPGQYASDEVVGALESVNITQNQTSLSVAVTVTTISGAAVTLENTVSSS